jgi:integrase/ribosomal protein L40E
VRQASLFRDPETYVANWPQELYREEVEKFYVWLKARKAYSPNSLQRYLVAFRALLKRLGKNPRELSLEDIFKLQPKPDEARVLKLYLKFLIEITEDERYEKLYKKVRVQRLKESLPEVLSREQIEKLLEACGKIDFELKVLAAVVYETGARIHEILFLKGRDIEFDQYGARIWIRRSKSVPRGVRVAVYSGLLTSWLEVRKPGAEEAVFEKSYDYYTDLFKKAWKMAGLPAVKRPWHSLRHARATELLKSRVFNEKEMMLWFGWKTRSMIDVYARVTMEDVEASYLAAVKGIEVKKEEPPKPKTCPRCGTLNPPDSRFCLKCAAPLTVEAEKQTSNLELLLQQLLKEVEELKRARK